MLNIQIIEDVVRNLETLSDEVLELAEQNGFETIQATQYVQIMYCVKQLKKAQSEAQSEVV